MSPVSTRKAHAVERAEVEKAFIRIGQIALFFSMVGIDTYYAERFDFPGVCYVVLVGAILGLDIKKVAKYIFKGRT